MYRLAMSVTVRPKKKNREKNRTKNHALPFDIFFPFRFKVIRTY